MSNNQVSVTNSSVTSDGQGHYVVYHQSPIVPLSGITSESIELNQHSFQHQQILSTHQLNNTNLQNFTQNSRFSSNNSNTMSSTSNSASLSHSRPRILARPTGMLSTIGVTSQQPEVISSSQQLVSTTSTIPRAIASKPTQQIVTQEHSSIPSPQIITFSGDNPTQQHVQLEQPNTITLYADNPSGTNTLMTTDGYATLNNIYTVESIPNLASTGNGVCQYVTADQVINIPGSGTVFLCPPNGADINLVPLIDPSDPNNQGSQFRFPFGDAGSNTIEYISLPSDAITTYGDQPVINLPNGTNYGNIVPITQQPDSSGGLVFSLEDQAMNSLAYQSTNIPPTEGNSFHSAAIPNVTEPVYTMAGASNLSTNAAVSQSQQQTSGSVGDFSDLLQLPPTESGSNWNFTTSGKGEDSSENTEGPLVSERKPNADDDDRDEGVLVIDEQPSTEPVQPDIAPLKIEKLKPEQGTKGSSSGQSVNAIHVIKLPTPKTKSILKPKGSPTTSPLRKSISKPVHLLPKTNDIISVTKPAIPVPAKLPIPQKSIPLTELTAVHLRNSMKSLELGSDVTVKFVDQKKLKCLAPKEPKVPFHLVHGLSKAVGKLEWSDGTGELPSFPAKFRVNESTGSLEIFDYNAEEHIRRIPLKVAKLENVPPATLKSDQLSSSKKQSSSKKTTPKVTKNASRTSNSITPKKYLKRLRTKAGQFASSSRGDEECEEEVEIDEPTEIKQVKEEKQPTFSSEVVFCVSCGAFATGEIEFIGKKCSKCAGIPQKVNQEPEKIEDDISSAIKYKLPKGTTVVKRSLTARPTTPENKSKRTPKAKVELSSNSPLVFAKKSAPQQLGKQEHSDLVGETAGITVVPILQTENVVKVDEKIEDDVESSLTSSSEEEDENVKQVATGRSKRRRTKKIFDTRRRKTKKLVRGRKRSIEKTKKRQSISKRCGNLAHSSSDGETMSTRHSNKEKGDPDFRKGGEFIWSKYLLETNSKAAPPRFFREPAFPSLNPFKTGMMVEAVDPQHQSLFCVASIVDIQGYRLRLHLTGYSELFDFWVNADSYEIFPPGWCEENGYKLEPPPNITEFNWHKYLIEEELVAAPRDLFAISKEGIIPQTELDIGMKLEAVDIRNMNLICVATVQMVINDRILVHFDDWDSVYDYWTDTSSPFIHPVGYCKKNDYDLTPPKNHKGTFSWETYLKETCSRPVPSQFFRPLPPIGFKKGMKLECVDKRNTFLIRVATIADVDDHQLLIHFDGWPSDYDYNVYECSGDIHPTGWCAATGHPLQTPPNPNEDWDGPCNVFGCLGLGHVKGYKFQTHNSEINCPYSATNMRKDLNDLLPDRFVSYKKSILVTQQHEAANSRRNSFEGTTFAKATKMRAQKRKSEALALAASASSETLSKKRKFSKNKAEPGSSVDSVKCSAEEGNTKEDPNDDDSLLHRRLTSRQSKTNLILSNLAQNGRGRSLSIEAVTPSESAPKRILIPNIESTITPVAVPTTSGGYGSNPVKLNWEGVNDLKKEKEDIPSVVTTTSTEFVLPSSTTMTPIPTPTSVSSISSVEPSINPKSPTLKTNVGELTISSCSSDLEEQGRSSSPFPSEDGKETEHLANLSQNINWLQEVVNTLNPGIVAKWKTKDVVEFVRKIPGCISASELFDDHKIDGEGFLLMTMTDFSAIMGIKMGPCIKLIKAIQLIQKNGGGGSLASLPSSVSITPVPFTSASLL